jgi:hypothetical protein
VVGGEGPQRAPEQDHVVVHPKAAKVVQHQQAHQVLERPDGGEAVEQPLVVACGSGRQPGPAVSRRWHDSGSGSALGGMPGCGARGGVGRGLEGGAHSLAAAVPWLSPGSAFGLALGSTFGSAPGLGSRGSGSCAQPCSSRCSWQQLTKEGVLLQGRAADLLRPVELPQQDLRPVGGRGRGGGEGGGCETGSSARPSAAAQPAGCAPPCSPAGSGCGGRPP